MFVTASILASYQYPDSFRVYIQLAFLQIEIENESVTTKLNITKSNDSSMDINKDISNGNSSAIDDSRTKLLQSDKTELISKTETIQISKVVQEIQK